MVMEFTEDDVVNLDMTFAEIIVDGLKAYRLRDKDNYPGVLMYPGADEKEIMSRWNDILDKMIWAFTQIKDWERESPINQYKFEMKSKSVNGLKINEIDVPAEVMAKHEKYRDKIQEGLNLFAKYFRCLND